MRGACCPLVLDARVALSAAEQVLEEPVQFCREVGERLFERVGRLVAVDLDPDPDREPRAREALLEVGAAVERGLEHRAQLLGERLGLVALAGPRAVAARRLVGGAARPGGVERVAEHLEERSDPGRHLARLRGEAVELTFVLETENLGRERLALGFGASHAEQVADSGVELGPATEHHLLAVGAVDHAVRAAVGAHLDPGLGLVTLPRLLSGHWPPSFRSLVIEGKKVDNCYRLSSHQYESEND